MNRRTFLKAALAGATAAALPFPLRAATPSAARLTISTRSLEVNGKAATIYSLVGPDGRPGLTLNAGSDFDVILRNSLAEDTLIHWHGLMPPWSQDGVPGLPMPMLAAGEERSYHFPVGAGGTHWMHAHTLQEQNLLAAPLIVRGAADGIADEQEVVVMLHDFSFKPAAELLAGLRGTGTPVGGAMAAMPGMPGMDQGSMAMGGMDMGDMPGMDHVAMPMAMDLNDIAYDAYLANDRTLDDPEVVQVDRSGTIRLRIINGATATAFTVDLGALEGTLIAVDGQPVVPMSGRQFPMAMAQRVDVRLQIPSQGGSFPILALREGAPERTGIVLATAGATIGRLSVSGDQAGPILDNVLEAGLRATAPLAQRPADRTFAIDLAGSMQGYAWSMPGAEAIEVRKGQRVEITMRNVSMMAHPMHLHGHHFQVVALDGRRFAGPVRDTVLVPPMRTVTLAVDANNPGRWAFHCHHLYHMASGMMATFTYEGVA